MSKPSVRSEFVALYRRWFEAIGAHDAGFFERTLAPDWVYVDVRGAVREKPSYIEYMVKTPPTVRFGDVDIELRLFGDVAVVQGTYFIDRSRAGLGPVRRRASPPCGHIRTAAGRRVLTTGQPCRSPPK